ncbi:GIY-YIG nuclease family protein [Trichocoleus desertorum]|uniref:GIY-YIG nuclease family protein n=1 Tax=Trichocoleus desertorum TaxID=1481672 RepID=UPI003296BDCD
MIDSNHRILFVGQAVNLLTRWKNHHRIYQLGEINKDYPVRIAWQTWNQDSLEEAEISEWQGLT